MRQVYGESKPMKKLFDNFDVCYYCMEEIGERIKCYRSDLGNLLLVNLRHMKELFDNSLING